MNKTNYKKNEVPVRLIKRWQGVVDNMAQIFDVPAGLIMRVWPSQIEVLVASVGRNNPYEPGEKADLGTGLYCETVMETNKQLEVPNALADPKWSGNPDVELNMISYLGVPLVMLDGSIFGTICILDRKTRSYTATYYNLLWKLRGIVEADLRSVITGENVSEEVDKIIASINEELVAIGKSPIKLGEGMYIGEDI